MFTYMTRVVRSTKILSFSARARRAVAVTVFCFGLSFGRPELPLKIWPGLSFIRRRLPFSLFLVGYMLVALINIFILINKEEGPIKIK